MKPARYDGGPVSACKGKTAYPSFSAAETVIRRKLKRRSRHSEPLMPYRCRHCQFWHLGGR